MGSVMRYMPLILVGLALLALLALVILGEGLPHFLERILP